MMEAEREVEGDVAAWKHEGGLAISGHIYTRPRRHSEGERQMQERSWRDACPSPALPSSFPPPLKQQPSTQPKNCNTTHSPSHLHLT